MFKELLTTQLPFCCGYKHEGTHDDDNADDDHMSISNPVANFFFSMKFFFQGKFYVAGSMNFWKKIHQKSDKKIIKKILQFF